MSFIFGTDVNFNNNDTKNFRAENVLAFPTLGAPDSGRIVLNTGLGYFYGWNGTQWIKFDGTGGGGGVSLAVNDEGIQVTPSATTLNFIGSSVEATDAGLGQVDITISVPPNSGLEQVTENSKTGWRFIGEIAGDNINRYQIGSRAIDAMLFDGSNVGQPDIPALPYGTKSTEGINFGVDNKDNAFYGSMIFGSANQTSAYAYATMIGGFNNIGYGYGDVAIGSYNTITPSNVNSFLFAMGHNNRLKASRGGAAMGLALINNSRGSTVVGVSNVEWTGGEAATNRPIFTVGIGTTTTPSGRWAQLVPKDGFNVHIDGRVIANSLTTALITADTSGKILITKEYADATYTGGGGGASHTVTDYRSSFEESDGKVYAGYLLDSVIVISRTLDGVVEFATGLTDLETDWTNRLSLTYV